MTNTPAKLWAGSGYARNYAVGVPTLNIFSAEHYVAKTVKGAIVGHGRVGPDAITVPFTFAGDPHTYSMDVWMEGSELYGEW